MPTVEEIINIGFTNHQEGHLEEAENAYREALELDSDNAEVCNLMGVLKLQQNNVDSALIWVEKAINTSPCEYFYETLFQAYIRAGLFYKIVECENNIIKNYPQSFSLIFNIALAYKNLKQNQKAISYYEIALKINPTSYKGWFNLAYLYNVENQGKNAISALKICRKLKPNDTEIEYFLSTSYLRTKNYDKGLKLFEQRMSRTAAVSLQNKTYPNLASFDKLWKGENIKDKTIFVYYEAGFGDTIMFARYLPILKKRCKKLIFYPPRPLVKLFSKTNLGIDEILDGFIPENNLNFDVHAPLMSLPYLLGLKGNEVFASPEGYLNADIELKKTYHTRYFDNDELKIGFKWQGNTYYDKDRVLPPEEFAPLIEIEGTKFYSFQTFEGSENLSKLTSKYKITDIGKDLIDFEQTAAALVNLDLVVCNDTSLAHLAGALGIPCFVLLPYEVNWRWHEDLSHCDWYNSLKLFRQPSVGDWHSLMLEVKKTISEHFN